MPVPAAIAVATLPWATLGGNLVRRQRPVFDSYFFLMKGGEVEEEEIAGDWLRLRSGSCIRSACRATPEAPTPPYPPAAPGGEQEGKAGCFLTPIRKKSVLFYISGLGWTKTVNYSWMSADMPGVSLTQRPGGREASGESAGPGAVGGPALPPPPP